VRKHLNDFSLRGSEIEIYLTGFLLVFICATFEEHIESLVNDRVSKSADAALASFVRNATSQLFRSIKTGEIAGLLGRFGDDFKKQFTEEMKKNQRAETFFNNLVQKRHGTAHKAGSDLTFQEVVRFYSEAHTVLDAVAAVIGSTS
jgi:S-methylmethionine-dependent homocysteine/selenocysteine methylase